MNPYLQILLAVWLVFSFIENWKILSLGSVTLDANSIRRLTSPTWFNFVELVLSVSGLLIAAGFLGVLRENAQTLSRHNYILLDANDTPEAKAMVEDWQKVAVKTGFGATSGAIGSYDHINPQWHDRFETVTATVANYPNLVASKEVTRTLGYWRQFAFDFINSRTMFLVSTTVMQAILNRNLNLTLTRQYYMLSFDWWQERDAADSNYMAPETFRKFTKMLWLGVKVDESEKLELTRLYEHSTKAESANHKQVLWFRLEAILTQIQED